MAFSHGMVIGWLSPFLPYLQSSDCHLKTGPVTADDVSWIGSLLCVGGFIGTISFGMITEKFGKRTAMFLLVIPHLSFWFLVFFSTHVYHLYFARALAGLSGGGSLRTITLFITEISENRIRGALGSFRVFATVSGILLIFIVGTYVNFFAVPLISLFLPTIFLVSLLFLHDTPTSLILRHKYDEAFESLKFYRTCGKEELSNENVKAEFEILKKTLETKSDDKLELKDFCEFSVTKNVMQALQISFFIFSNETGEKGFDDWSVFDFSQSIFWRISDHYLYG